MTPLLEAMNRDFPDLGQVRDEIVYATSASPPGVLITHTRMAAGRVEYVSRIVAHRHLTDKPMMAQVLDILASRLDLRWTSPC